MQLGGEAHARELAHEPFGTGADVAAVFGISGDAGETEAGEEIVEGGHGWKGGVK
ncbi:hypothetical protein BGE01nite_31140 [Brevifollis gellanilyticus]|uniref:Uncharacterized protein n=1 Tax=Brevifollis gellanilyticus TaxID=748831 RepID=A0A512MAS2_9BACT|nr:hypothetical protein BGE01nite_31140 [Brevifollis gellanilyticus]